MDSVNGKCRMGMYFSVFSASLGGFCSGTVLGWSSAVLYLPLDRDQEQFLIPRKHLALAASMAPLGALIIALPSKKLADSIGRTPTMLFAMALFLLSWIMLAFEENNLNVVIAGRLIAGMAMGASCLVTQIYIMEISSNSNVFLILFQIFVSLGLIFVNSLLLFTTWQEYHLLPGLFPLIFALCFLNLPESPLYCAKNGKINKAEKCLEFLGIKEAQESNDKIEIFKKSNFRPIIACLGLAVYQQLTNIFGIYFYLGPIINKTSLNFSPFISIMIIYLIDILTQLASIGFLEKSKRKLLLLISATFIALAYFSLGFFYQLLYCNVNFNYKEYIPIVLICIIFIAYSIGFSTVPDLILKDLFETTNNSLYVFMNVTRWLIGFLVTYFYPTMMDKFQEYDKFYYFGLTMLSGIIFVVLLVPETKGKSYKFNM